jgi:integrase
MQRQHVRYILDRLPAGLLVGEIDETVIEHLVSVEGGGRRLRADGSTRELSAATMLKRLSTLRHALKLQKRHRVIDRIPEFPEILHSYQPDRKFIRTYAEAVAIAAALPSDRTDWYWLAFWTGQHNSDVERMTKEDILPLARDRWVRVRNTKNRRFEGVRIGCPAELAKVFRSKWAKLKPGALLVEPWPHVGGQLADTCERIGLPRYTAKSLRHTFFTWMISRVGITKAVMEIGGWSSYDMVVKVYGHALAPQFREAILALDRFVTDEGRRPPRSADSKPPPALLAPGVTKGAMRKEEVPSPVLLAPARADSPTNGEQSSEQTGTVEHVDITRQCSVGAERIELSTNGLRECPPLPFQAAVKRDCSPTGKRPTGKKWDPTTTG